MSLKFKLSILGIKVQLTVIKKFSKKELSMNIMIKQPELKESEVK